MNAFQKFYLWGMHAKFFMGLYFAAIVFLVGILTALFGGESIKLLNLLEMFLLSLVIAFVQTALMPASADFSHGILFGRSALWLGLSCAGVWLFSYFGNWFAGLPFWCSLLLTAFMLFGYAAMLVGMKLEQDADTIRLNKALRHHQN